MNMFIYCISLYVLNYIYIHTYTYINVLLFRYNGFILHTSRGTYDWYTYNPCDHLHRRARVVRAIERDTDEALTNMKKPYEKHASGRKPNYTLT